MASEDNRKSETVIEIIDLNDKVSKSKRGVWTRFTVTQGNEESSYFAIFLKLVVYVVLDLSFVYITFVVLIDMMSSLLPFSSLIYVGFL